VKKSQISQISVLLVLLAAAGLRFYLLDGQSFWNDEGNTARLSERSVRLIIEGTASDIHPPLYYLALRGWRELVGESEFGLRSFSAFAGILTIAVASGLGKILMQRRRGAERGGRAVAVVTAVLVAINPALIYYSQEARMYALLGLWTVLSSMLLVRWWKRPSLQLATGYVLAAAAGLYTHYFFPAVLAAQNVIVLVWILKRIQHKDTKKQRHEEVKEKSTSSPLHPFTPSPFHSLRSWVIMMLAILFLYAPWLPIFLSQFGNDPIQRVDVGAFLLDSGRWMLFGSTIGETAVSSALAIGVLLVALGVGNRRWQLLLPAATIVISLGFLYYIGTGAEFYKFLVVAVPFLSIILATAWGGVWLQNWGKTVVMVLLAVLLLPSWQSLQNMYHDPAYARADYRGVAARIQAAAHPDAGVILDAPNQWEVFTYYYPDDGTIYPLPKGRTAPTAAEIDATLADIAAKHDRLYAIFWGETQRDPERLVERWLDAHAFKATDEWIGDVRFVTYAVPMAAATEMETAVSIPFGEHIILEGYTLRVDGLRAGDIVQVTLFWQTAVPLNTRYKVFLHLIDESGHPIAQRDSEPGGGLALTTSWEPGKSVVDNHGVLLPFELPEGQLSLVLGLYDIADPTNRLLINTGGKTVDSLPLTTFSVNE
jgi:mannosyltransferase